MEHARNADDIFGNGVGRQQLAAFILATRIADLGGAAADQRDWPVAGLLQAAQQHDRGQIADVERWRGGIITIIRSHDRFVGQFVEPVGIGQLVDMAAFA